MKIGAFDTNKKVFIVAEIGNNHEGNYLLAEKMIRLASKAGADAVKFQTIVPEALVSVRNEQRFQQLKRFQLRYDQFVDLSRVAQEEGVVFLSTPFDSESAHFLETLVPAFKIASGDNNFFPLIKTVADTGKPIIVSSGLCDLTDVVRTKNFIEEIWRKKGIVQELAILHCVVSYPAPREEANLGAIHELKKLGICIGYSDHTMGIDAAVSSVAVGARIIEKHFTIDKNYSDFHDHRLSVDPKEFSELVKKIRETEILLGSGIKRIQDSERENEIKVRRSVVAKHDLKKGRKLYKDDIAWVRPGGGLQPGEENLILGKKLMRSISQGEMIQRGDVIHRKKRSGVKPCVE